MKIMDYEFRIKKFYNDNIVKRSAIFDKYITSDSFQDIEVLSMYHIPEQTDLRAHIAEFSGSQGIEETPNSDNMLLQWISERRLMLLARDFALSNPVNKSIRKSDFCILGDELFYKIKSSDENARLKLSVAKSWIFAGLIFEENETQFNPVSSLGLVMGIHSMDAYVIVFFADNAS